MLAIGSALHMSSSEKRCMRLRRRAIFVLRTALLYMMTEWSRMSTANLSATSVTNSEQPTRAFATLRFAGDTLDPVEISRILNEEPTRAYRKGQRYRPSARSPEITGKTGVWYFSTRRTIPGNDLTDHLDVLLRLIFPFADADKRLKELRDIMEREDLEAHVTCFWRGPSDAPTPSIPLNVTASLQRLPADIEADFANE
jgi:Domain of unknown function (DUF4279)